MEILIASMHECVGITVFSYDTLNKREQMLLIIGRKLNVQEETSSTKCFHLEHTFHKVLSCQARTSGNVRNRGELKCF